MITVEATGTMGREAGFVRDVRAIAGRALRQIPREPAAVIPAIFVPAFFYSVNLGALEKLAGTSLDYKAFLLPMAIAFAVTGMSRAPALVTDIQGGYFDRLCMTPIKRSALLLGLMVADVAVIATLCLPVLAIGADCRGAFCHRATGSVGIRLLLGSLGSGVHVLPVRRRIADGQSRRRKCVLRHLLPAVLPHRRGGSEATSHWVVLRHRHIQPGDVSAGSTSFSHHIRLASRTAVGRIGGCCGTGRGRASRSPSQRSGPEFVWRIERKSTRQQDRPDCV